MDKTKPCGIAKRDVWEAYKQMKANHGAAGVDGQSIEPFEEDVENNLYRLWNRLASGSYVPSPVRRTSKPGSRLCPAKQVEGDLSTAPLASGMKAA